MRRLTMVTALVLPLALTAGGVLGAEEEPREAGAFGPAGRFSEDRVGHTATPLPDGRVLIVGGYTPLFDVLASAEVWDPASGTLAPAGSLTEARAHHTATLLPDGRVVVGGAGEGHILLASAEAWEPIAPEE